jgi:hypothetical protein
MSPVIRMRHWRNCSQPVQCDSTCTHCGTHHGKAQDKARRVSSGRNTQLFKRLAAEAIARDGRCMHCGKNAREAMLAADHISYAGPVTSASQLQALCESQRPAQRRTWLLNPHGGVPRETRPLNPPLSSPRKR